MNVTVTAKFPVSLDLDIDIEPMPSEPSAQAAWRANLEDRVTASLDALSEQSTITGYLAEWMVTEGGGWDTTVTKESGG